jgi:hypothetical protein
MTGANLNFERRGEERRGCAWLLDGNYAAEHIHDHVFHGVYYGTRKQEQKNCKDVRLPRRGTHRANSIGSSMGGGQPFPTTFFHNVLKTVVLTGLLAQKPFRCIAGFTNSVYPRT